MQTKYTARRADFRGAAVFFRGTPDIAKSGARADVRASVKAVFYCDEQKISL